MKNLKKLNLILLLVVMAVLFAACGGKKNGGSTKPTGTPTPSPTGTSTPTPTPTDTPTPTFTPTPTPVIYLDALETEGIRFDGTPAGNKSMVHLLFQDYSVKYKNDELTSIQVVADGKGHLAFGYGIIVSDVESDEFREHYYMVFGSMENGRIRIDSTTDMGVCNDCWVTERNGAVLATMTVSDEEVCSRAGDKIRIFDFSGQELTSGTLKDETVTGSIYLSAGLEYYYESDRETCSIRKVNFNTGEKTEVKYPENLLLTGFYGVTRMNGVDYLCASFIGVDLKKYEGVINSDTGEMLYLAAWDEIGYIYSSDENFTIKSNFASEYGMDSVICTGSKLISYHEGTDFAYNYRVLGDKMMISKTSYETRIESFTSDYDGEVYEYTIVDKTMLDIALVDITTGKEICTNVITLSGEMDMGQCYFVSAEQLMVTFSDLAGRMEYYLWNVDGNKYSTVEFADVAQVTISDFAGFDIPKVEGSYKRDDFIPGVCPDEYEEEREYADLLEKKYDIKIYIADEAKCIMSGYVYELMHDKMTIKYNLEQLDEELSKYPEGFFSLYKKTSAYEKGLIIYFTGGLLGFEGGTLDRAGGLRTEQDGAVIIALDGYDGRYEAAIHHEISHSIEVLIENLGTEQLDEDKWNGINVTYGGDRVYYADSYSHQDSDYLYGFSKNYKYTYEGWSWYPGKYKQVLFIDDYAMTFPTEDRSRIWERIMYDRMDIRDFPALYEKMTYYSMLIKKMLVEQGYDATTECYWEWVFAEPEEAE